VTASAPAKVNLWLGVGAPGRDGYHPLATVFHALNLEDKVRAESTEPGSGIRITVEGEGADSVPTDASNLAWRAAEAVSKLANVSPDVHLHLIKSIPVAGGMAGGSADAAAALVACDALWNAGLSRSDLHALGATLGSDVPFALHGGTAIGTGRGDQLTPVLGRGEYHWVLAFAEGGLSTPDVYAELDRLRGDDVQSPGIPDGLMAALRAGDPLALGGELGNDLEPAALSLRPSLGLLIEDGLDAGALGAQVSGSGPTCVFLAKSRDHALDLAARLSGTGSARTVATASGPAAGARIVG
jgi:4-diphosphocytidyl-2-C-methyl-D-erythritol kinase